MMCPHYRAAMLRTVTAAMQVIYTVYAYVYQSSDSTMEVKLCSKMLAPRRECIRLDTRLDFTEKSSWQ